MDVENAIIQSMQEILGIEDLEGQRDLDLLESGLVDSLGIVTLIGRIEELVGHKIEIKNMKASDFISIRTMTDTISAQIGTG